MELGRFFLLKDFFNYYIAGAIWLVDIFPLFAGLSEKPEISILITKIPQNTIVQTTLFSICIIIFPYSTGFAFFEIGSFLSKRFYDKNKSYSPGELNKATQQLCRSYAKKLFEIDPQDFQGTPEQYFYQIRNYVANVGGVAYAHADRDLDLANFAESLLVPLPLLIFLLFDITNFHCIFPCALSIIAFVLIGRGRLILRKYWIDNIYRTFAVLAAREQNGNPNVIH
jgi:hypothetical protein